MKKEFFQKSLLALPILALLCALFLGLVFLITNGKIQKNQEAEIEETLSLLFPQEKDLNRKEERFETGQIHRLYTFTDTSKKEVAYAAVFSAKDQHQNTFLLIAKADGSIIGLRPLKTMGSHSFPQGDYNEAFLDSFKGKTAPISFEEALEGSAFTDTLRPLSKAVNTVLAEFTAKGEEK